MKSWGKIWGRNHHHLHYVWRTKHRNWSLPKSLKESENWAPIPSLCRVSEPWDHLPLLQGVNHRIFKNIFLKQQNSRRLRSLQFEIYLFNGFQMQPRLHSEHVSLKLMVSVQVLEQMCAHHRAQVESEISQRPEQKGDGWNGEESSSTINYLMKYQKNPTPHWQKSKHLVSRNW